MSVRDSNLIVVVSTVALDWIVFFVICLKTELLLNWCVNKWDKVYYWPFLLKNCNKCIPIFLLPGGRAYLHYLPVEMDHLWYLHKSCLWFFWMASAVCRGRLQCVRHEILVLRLSNAISEIRVKETKNLNDATYCISWSWKLLSTLSSKIKLYETVDISKKFAIEVSNWVW